MALDFRAELLRIDTIETHPNADRLEVAVLKGWTCIVPKDRYAVGDLVCYIPIDSILPEALENLIFPADSKIKLKNHRVKTLKLRGAFSQGLIVDISLLHGANYSFTPVVDKDVTAVLGITKYEPEVPHFQQSLSKKKTYKNPYFREYVDMANAKNYTQLFKPEDKVVITEKIHGTNFRAGWAPFVANSSWRKVLKLVGLAPKYVFVYGSRRVQLSEKLIYNGFYEENIYADAVKKYDLIRRIPKGIVVFGEIYGAGVQKGYTYGCKANNREIVLFDAMDSSKGEYLNWQDFYLLIDEMEMHDVMVPVLYEGLYGEINLKEFIGGPSIQDPEQLVREGCVIKSHVETQSVIGRKMLKAINPVYLLGDQSDFH